MSKLSKAILNTPNADWLVDSTGNYAFNPNVLAQAMTYNGPGGTLDSVTYGPDSNGYKFKQTLTYASGKLTAVSGWVKV